MQGEDSEAWQLAPRVWYDPEAPPGGQHQEHHQEQPQEEPEDQWWAQPSEQKTYAHRGSHYKKVLNPALVVVGNHSDFGRFRAYVNRVDWLRDIRMSIRFSQQWLYEWVIRTKMPCTDRLRKNLRRSTRESQYKDLVEYERYLRRNIEYRFVKVVIIEVRLLLSRTKMPLEHYHVVLSFLC